MFRRDPTRDSVYHVGCFAVNDKSILVAIAQGDPSARELLVQRHGQSLLREARRLGVRADAGDVANEIFLRVFETADDLTEVDFPRWARNQVRAKVRKRRRHQFGHLPSSGLLSPRTSPSEAVARGEQREAFQDAAGCLSEEDWEALSLVYGEGLSPTEAAAVLGVGPSTVRSRLTRLRRRMGDLLRRLGLDV